MTAAADEEAPHEEEAQQPAAPSSRSSWSRRLAPLLLVVGAMFAASMLFGRVPKEREIELRLDDAAAIRRLDVTWTDASSARGANEGTPLQGSSWTFSEGTAPRSLHTTVRLPDGSYNLEIAVDRAMGHDSTRRVITLSGADRIAIPVR